MTLNLPSIVQKFTFFGQEFWLKRDDLIHKDFDGNKARKFYSLLNLDLSGCSAIISHGGSQSNAMYSLSVLAKNKNIAFKYCADSISSYLKQNPCGNYANALQNGMELIDEYNPQENELFIPQGGACEYARDGLLILANELNDFCKNMKNPKAVISSGTGASAFYLSQYFKGTVYAVPCVGDRDYLSKQFSVLGNSKAYILPTAKKYAFGALNSDIYDMYLALLDFGVEFDLLYDAIAWIAVKENLNLFDNESVFIHSGGLRSNETMLARYARYNNKNI